MVSNVCIFKDSFSYAIAQKLCDKYQCLIQQALCKDGLQVGTIRDVVIAPFDETNKAIFLQFYKHIPCEKLAIQFYKPPYYDVILLVHSIMYNEIFYVTLGHFLHSDNLSAGNEIRYANYEKIAR